jgi:hypothetical protein
MERGPDAREFGNRAVGGEQDRYAPLLEGLQHCPKLGLRGFSALEQLYVVDKKGAATRESSSKLRQLTAQNGANHFEQEEFRAAVQDGSGKVSPAQGGCGSSKQMGLPDPSGSAKDERSRSFVGVVDELADGFEAGLTARTDDEVIQRLGRVLVGGWILLNRDEGKRAALC